MVDQPNLAKIKLALANEDLAAKIRDSVKSRISSDYNEIKIKNTEPSVLVQ